MEQKRYNCQKGVSGMVGISLTSLPLGKTMARDLYDEKGRLLLPRGTVLQSFHVQSLLRLGYHTVYVSEGDGPARDKSALPSAYLTAIEGFRQIMDTLMQEGEAGRDQVEETVEQLYPHVLETNNILSCLRNLRSRDEYTYQHSVSVSVLAIKLGQTMKIPREDLKALGTAGLLHDIGKCRIPLNILNKPGKLNDEEWKLINCHPVYGYEIVKKMHFDDARVGLSVLQHHERLDGSGYPEGKTDGDIHYFARIVAVSDVFDALTSERFYRRRVPMIPAIKEVISSTSGHLDPQISCQLLRYILDVLPGEEVLLNTGELATVIRTFEADPARPLVRIGERFVDLRTEHKMRVMDLWA